MQELGSLQLACHIVTWAFVNRFLLPELNLTAQHFGFGLPPHTSVPQKTFLGFFASLLLQDCLIFSREMSRLGGVYQMSRNLLIL